MDFPSRYREEPDDVTKLCSRCVALIHYTLSYTVSYPSPPFPYSAYPAPSECDRCLVCSVLPGITEDQDYLPSDCTVRVTRYGKESWLFEFPGKRAAGFLELSVIPAFASMETSVKTVPCPIILEDPEFRSTLALSSAWLSKCCSKHKCDARRPSEDHAWTPTRLIDVSDYPTLRLIEKTEILPMSQYMTLSHCWGNTASHERICLTSDNIHRWKNALPSLENMKTFKDAIQITRALGTKYIWIDSLCIMQNCEDDWRAEAALMWKVYKYSYCNVSATGARADTEGCFVIRNPLRSDYAYFSIPIPKNFSSQPVSRLEKAIKSWPDQIRELNAQPAHRRAWIAQEAA